MLNKLRNFTKTKLATVLIGIIIIPFVFWGMGGVFQGGNTNNIAKIKNVNISTEDFFDHIRSLGINEEIISKNIENNILTEILNDLLAKKFIELEIKKLGININDKSLLLIIKNNKNFLDENYGDAFVSEFLDILNAEHGIALKEYDDENMNDNEPDTPFAVGANPSGAGGGG